MTFGACEYNFTLAEITTHTTCRTQNKSHESLCLEFFEKTRVIRQRGVRTKTG